MIIIDTRLGSRDLLKHPPLNDTKLVYPAFIEDCDVYFSGNGPGEETISIGIEVKTITELISSTWSDRFQSEQIPKLRRYDRPFVLTYGDTQCDDKGYLKYRPHFASRFYPVRFSGSRGNPVPYYYYTAIQTELDELGVKYRHVDSIETAAFWIASLYEWHRRPYKSHKLFKTLGKYTDLSRSHFDKANLLCPTDVLSKDQELIAQVANKLPGLGFKRALAAALHFPSIWAMMSASVEEWAEIVVPPGKMRIGKVTARRVHRVIRKQASQKQERKPER